jgi:hypothetical protein
MNLWQRVIAIFVLMVFMPASVLAGTPLRFCIGDDGHRAIEFVLAPDHHVDAEIGHSPDCSGPEETQVAPPTGCSDTPLLSVAQSSTQAKAAKDIFSLDDPQKLAALVTQRLLVEFEIESNFVPQSFSTVRDHSQLDALRTVVLLI